MSSIGLIPIRYRSSRLPNKPFQMCACKPLIDWTIEAIINSKLDAYVVLTSSESIQAWCKKHKIPFIERPRGLEGDRSPILDTINWINDNPLIGGTSLQMLLQVTNPTRTNEDIDKCLELMNIMSVNSICSTVDVGEYHPTRMYKPTLGLGLEPYDKGNQWCNTQELPKMVLRDGSIYCWRTKAFKQFKGRTLLPQRIARYEIEPERSIRVDTPRDLKLAENWLTNPFKSLSLQ